MRRHIALLVPLATATTAAAEPLPLDGRQLKEMVAGSSVTIDAPMGYKLPIRHGEDGSLSGDAGGLAFYLGSRTDSGRWRVKGDKLCYKWDRWFSGEERCMKVSAEGDRIHWVKDDGDTGTGTVVARAEPKPAEARAADKAGEPKIAQAAIPTAAAPPPSARGATSPAAKPAPVAALAGTVTRPAAKPVPAAPVNASTAVATPRPTVVAAADPRPIAAKPAAKAMRVGGPPPPPEPAFRVVSVEPDDVLNIRIGPSAEHLAVGAIPPDARGVRLVGACVTEWCPVRHRGIVGWVHRYYLVEDPAVR